MACPMCGGSFHGAPNAVFCSATCRLRAFRLRKSFERRTRERQITAAILDGDMERARRLVETAQPPSIRPGLRRHLERAERQHQAWTDLMDRLEHIVAHGLAQGAGFPRRRARPIPREPQ